MDNGTHRKQNKQHKFKQLVVANRYPLKKYEKVEDERGRHPRLPTPTRTCTIGYLRAVQTELENAEAHKNAWSTHKRELSAQWQCCFGCCHDKIK